MSNLNEGVAEASVVEEIDIVIKEVVEKIDLKNSQIETNADQVKNTIHLQDVRKPRIKSQKNGRKKRLVEENNTIEIMSEVVDEEEGEDEEVEIEIRIKMMASTLKTIEIRITNILKGMIGEVKAKEDQTLMAQEIVIMLICKMNMT